MPWFGTDFADEFSQAVGLSLGLPNELFCTPFLNPCYGHPSQGGAPVSSAPLFSWFTNYTVGDGGVFIDYVVSSVYINDGSQFVGVNEVLVLENTSMTWAKATLVPAPLPILGVAAAFRASRRLKRRVKDRGNTVSRSLLA
jgi:hypothetical protein